MTATPNPERSVHDSLVPMLPMLINATGKVEHLAAAVAEAGSARGHFPRPSDKIPRTIRYMALGCLFALGCSAVFAGNSKRPNILWVTSEDNNVNWVGCYGNAEANTPNIDRLATEGFRYTQAYANAPVCAPSRCTWITGVNAVSLGTQHMRSRYEIPHNLIGYYTDYLRQAGYYTGNDSKTDYNIGGRQDKTAWDNLGKVDWQALKTHQPFFQVINLDESHESRARGPIGDLTHSTDDVRLAAYHPDIPMMRKNYAKYHDAVTRMDTDLGAVLKKLQESGLADDTIVVYCSDHGGVMPRSKRYLYSSGLHSPLVIRIPEKFRNLWPAKQPGDTVERLVSFVDMPATWLSIAGAKVPDVMQGRPFLGAQAQDRDYHFAFRGRMDERLDNARAATDGKYLYIRNYMPYVPWMQHQSYQWGMRGMAAWEQYVRAGKGTHDMRKYFFPKQSSEELYDLTADPDNVNNLIGNAEYAAIAENLKGNLRNWQVEIVDAGLLPESEMKRLADLNGTTIYEFANNPDLYNLPKLLDAADIALAANPKNLDALRQMLRSDNIAERYWGMVGCFLLNDKSGAEIAAADASDEVRAMAAWQLVRSGEKARGTQIIGDMIKENSYALLSVLNIIDWMESDADAETFSRLLKAYPPKGMNQENQARYLQKKFSES